MKTLKKRSKAKAYRIPKKSSPLELLLPPDPPPPPKKVVRWTEEECQELAQRIIKRWGRHPEESIYTLLNKVQESDWPAEKKRKVACKEESKRIFPFIRAVAESARQEKHENAERLITLTSQVDHYRTQPTREDMIALMPEEEIRRRFTRVVLEGMAPSDVVSAVGNVDELLQLIPLGKVFEHFATSLLSRIELLETTVARQFEEMHRQPVHQNGKTNGHHIVAPQHRVALVGFQVHTLEMLRPHVANRAELVLVQKANNDKDSQLPSGITYCIIDHRHTPPHQMKVTKQQFPHAHYVHKGSGADLVKSIDLIPPLKRK